MQSFNKEVASFKESIFATMTKIAQKNNAINLSQGFPDFDGPNWLKELAYSAMKDGHNQYAPMPGLLELRQVVSKNYNKFYGINYDPQNEITILNGATEAIFCTIKALINPGDEVIVFEPFYDSYVASLQMSGAKIIPVTLKLPDFTFDKEELANSFGTKTKLVIINTPHNPTGKIFNNDEIALILNLASKYDSYILSDEVYEFLTYDGHNHRPTAFDIKSRDRVITISSTGKTFGVTGWKIGWACAHPLVTQQIRLVHQFTTFSVATPLQWAMVKALEQLDQYLPNFRQEYKAKRDFFCQGLKAIGYGPLLPAGTYFTVVPIHSKTSLNDVDYCLELIEKKKVAAIPPSAFYLKSAEGQKYIRFCFAKKQDTLERALQNLRA